MKAPVQRLVMILPRKEQQAAGDIGTEEDGCQEDSNTGTVVDVAVPGVGQELAPESLREPSPEEAPKQQRMNLRRSARGHGSGLRVQVPQGFPSIEDI